MTLYTFGPWLTIDQAGEPVPGAGGLVYAEGDDGFSTPLTARGLAGEVMGTLVSGPTGILPPFTVEDHSVVVWKSGDHLVVVASWRGMQEAAAAAAGAADDAVGTASAAVLAAQSAAAAAQLAAQSAGSALPPVASVAVTAHRTLVSSDAGKVLDVDSATPVTITVPAHSSVAFPVGVSVLVRQYGSGEVTIAGATDVDVRSRGGASKLAGQYADAVLTKRADNEWVLSGDVVA